MEAIDTNKEFDVFQLFMINYFNKDVCDAAGLNFKDDLIPLQVGFKENVAEILNKDDIKIEGVCAGAAIYSTKALEAVKLDDENYFDSNFFAYFEDVDLSLRLKGAGYKFKLLKDSIVYHMHSATGGKTSGFKEYYLTRNLFMYTKRNQTIEEYKKHKKEYYIRFLKTVAKNINNFNAIKSAVKGLSDGLKESKKIEYWKIQQGGIIVRKIMDQNELYHHGIKGQKWGVRRYQNPDGSLTNAGKKKYGTKSNYEKVLKAKGLKAKVKAQKEREKQNARTEAEVAKYKRRAGIKEEKDTTSDKPKTAKDKPHVKTLSEMTNEEIQERIDRINLENRLKALTPHQKTRGEEMEILCSSTT